MRHLKFAVGLSLALLVFSAFGQTPQTTPSQNPSPSPSPQQGIQQHSYFDATAKWPDPQIYVCWENPETKFQSEMELVQTSVKESWEAASKLRFTGWQKCGLQNRGIRILIDDSGALVQRLGRHLEDELTGYGMNNGMVLNFTFKNWNQKCQTDREMCIKSIAVHEFGHAIGFAHEQNRPDTPGECTKMPQGDDGTVLLTPYDPDSVMNYCNEKYNNYGKLSKYDTKGVQAIYGSPAPNPSPTNRIR